MDAKVFKSLLKVRFYSLGASLTNNSNVKKGKKILYGLLFLYLAVVMLLYFGFIFYSICAPYCSLGFSWFYFGFVGIFALILCFVGSVFTTQAQIYRAKDNDLLFSMPIKPAYILGSRMLAVTALNYVYALLVFIPAGVVYCMNYTPSVAGVVIYVLLSLALPLLSQALSCIAAWFFELIGSKTKHKNIITIVLSLGFLALYFAFVFRINTYLTKLVTEGATIAAAVKKAFFPAYYYGIAVTEHNIAAILISLITSILPFAASYAVLSKNLRSFVSANRGTDKKKYVEKKLKVKSPAGALLSKELAHFGSSAGYIMNSAIGSVLAVILSVMLIMKRDAVNSLFEELGMSGSPMAILMAMGIAMCVSMNFVSAPSISLEAKTIWILKTIPVKIKDILMSKVYLHIVVTAPFAVLCSAVSLAVLRPDLVSAGILFLLPIVITVFGGFFGVVINLNLPKFNWTNEIQAVKQGMSSFISMLIGIVSIIVPVILYLMFFAEKVSVTVYIYIMIAVFAIICGALYLYILKWGEKKFKAL